MQSTQMQVVVVFFYVHEGSTSLCSQYYCVWFDNRDTISSGQNVSTLVITYNVQVAEISFTDQMHTNILYTAILVNC